MTAVMKHWGVVSAVAVGFLGGIAKAEPEQAVEVVITGDRTEQAPTDTETTHTIEREQMLDETPASIADVFRRAPGASVQQTAPGQPTVYVRGFSGRAIAHVVDGVRLNSTIFRAGNNPYAGLIDPLSLERAVLVAGPSSTRYGSDALGGALELHHRLPDYRFDGPRLQARTTQSFISNPLSIHSHAGLALLSEKRAIDVGLTAVRAGPVSPGAGERTPARGAFINLERGDEGYEPLTTHAQEGTEYESFAASLAARHKIGPGRELVLRAQTALRPELLRYDRVNPLFAEGPPEAADSALRPMTRHMTSLSYIQRKHDSWYSKGEFTLAWQQIAERQESVGLSEVCLSPVQAEECTPRLLPSAEQEIEKNRTDSFSLSGSIALGGAEAVLPTTVGADVYHDVVSSEKWTVLRSGGRREQAAARYPDGSTDSRMGVFFESLTPEVAGLSAKVGARAGAFLLRVAERPEVSPALDLSLLDWAANAGVRYRIAPGVKTQANVGRGLRVPNVQDLATLGRRAQGRFQVPNEDLGSEHSVGADLGLEVELEPLRGTTTLFWLEQQDAIVLGPASNTAPTEEDLEFVTSRNAASVETFGSEGTWWLHLSDAWELELRWLFTFGQQRNPADLGLPEQTPADRVPPHQGHLGVNYTLLPQLRLSVFASGRAKQQRLNDPTNLDDNRIPDTGTPGYLTWHARASYLVSPALRLRAAVDNITDETYVEHGSGFYGPGFSAALGLDFQYDTAL